MDDQYAEKKWSYYKQKESYDAISNLINDNQEKYVNIKKIKQSINDDIKK